MTVGAIILYVLAAIAGIVLVQVGLTVTVAIGYVVLTLLGLIAVVCFVVWIVLWFTDKGTRTIGRIIAAVVVLALAVVLLIICAPPAWTSVKSLWPNTQISDNNDPNLGNPQGANSSNNPGGTAQPANLGAANDGSGVANATADKLSANNSGANDADDSADTSGSKTNDEAKPLDITGLHIDVAVKLDTSEQLQDWVKENVPSKTWDELKSIYDDGSLLQYEKERKAAVKAAGGTNITNPVAKPYEKIEELKKAGSITPSELAELLEYCEEETIIKIMTDSLFADMVSQCLNKWVVVGEQNEWFRDMLEDNDAIFANTDEAKRGINGFLWTPSGTKIHLIRDEHFENNVRVAALVKLFNWEAVEARQSTANWHLPTAKTDSDLRICEASRQVKQTAIILRYYYLDAEGNQTDKLAWDMGFGIYDKRCLDYSGDNPAPNGPGQNPGPGSTPKTYSIIAECYERKTDKLIQTVTLRSGLSDGAEDIAKAPNIPGYTVYGDKEYDVKIEGKDKIVKFLYDKSGGGGTTTTKWYSLSYQRGYYNYLGNWTLIDSSPIYVGSYTSDQTYEFDVSAPASDKDTRYSLAQSHYKDKMPARNEVVRVVVTVQHPLNISYKQVTENGSIDLPGASPHSSWRTEGEGFNVPNPRLKDHTARYYDPLTETQRTGNVSGTMRDKPIWVTVFYYKDGDVVDGDLGKNPATDAVNTPQDFDPDKSNAQGGGGDKSVEADKVGGLQSSDPEIKDLPTEEDSPFDSSDRDDEGEPADPEPPPLAEGETGHDGGYDEGRITEGANSGQVTTTEPNDKGGTITITEDIANTTFGSSYAGGEP